MNTTGTTTTARILVANAAAWDYWRWHPSSRRAKADTAKAGAIEGKITGKVADFGPQIYRWRRGAAMLLAIKRRHMGAYRDCNSLRHDAPRKGMGAAWELTGYIGTPFVMVGALYVSQWTGEPLITEPFPVGV
ncbi:MULTISPECIES: hypothetical protein [Isoptericola]|uniref:hypothetical protein n=1 Tax=Isoptericola TaxID=254250 RepID=UPI00383BF1EF